MFLNLAFGGLFSEGQLVDLLGVHVDDAFVSFPGQAYEAKISELRQTWKSERSSGMRKHIRRS